MQSTERSRVRVGAQRGNELIPREREGGLTLNACGRVETVYELNSLLRWRLAVDPETGRPGYALAYRL